MFKMLIVDDESAVVDSLADMIPWRELGIDVVFKANSGYEAMEVIKSNAIDILITDIHMPGMSGLELIEETRRKWKRMKCLLLSGHAEFDYAQKAIRHDTFEYLLKPISDEVLFGKVAHVVQLLEKEREELQSYQRLAQAFEESLPKLRGELLNDLLQGMKYAPRSLEEKMQVLKMSVSREEPFALMLVRMEGKFTELDLYSLSLMEFAVGNMAEEIFEDYFQLWPCKDVHGFLVFLVMVKPEKREKLSAQQSMDQQLQPLASQLQMSVNHYLKGTVSVLISTRGQFPSDVDRLYQDSLYSLRRRVGKESGLFIYVKEEVDRQPVHSLQRLYEPPMLIHLLESANWELVEEKLQGIFLELQQKWADSSEHLIEVYFSIYASFSSLSHKNGHELAQMIGPHLSDAAGLTACRSIHALESWTFQALRQMRQSMENETRNDRELTVDKIKQYVQKHLTEDVSLQAVADYMYMHPVHVSRVYKMETGENLSDYILRLKMEMAASLLSDRSLKNYEIALRLGYQNPNYFNKVFKKYYALTPQEYRSKAEESH